MEIDVFVVHSKSDPSQASMYDYLRGQAAKCDVKVLTYDDWEWERKGGAQQVTIIRPPPNLRLPDRARLQFRDGRSRLRFPDRAVLHLRRPGIEDRRRSADWQPAGQPKLARNKREEPSLSALLLQAIHLAGARRGRLSKAERIRETTLLEVLTTTMRSAR